MYTKTKDMTIQELKNNREEIIEVINEKNIYNTPMNLIMTKFAEYAQLGCVGNYDIEEVEEIVMEVVEELKGYNASIERVNNQNVANEIKEREFFSQRGSFMR